MQYKKIKLNAKRSTLNALTQRGSIVVLGLLIATGIIVISAELALYVASALRQARTIDSSTLAYFSAESGVENALYQIRKSTTFTGVLSETKKDLDKGKWSFLENDSATTPRIDVQKFSNTTDRLEKSFFERDSTIQVPLYETTMASGNVSGMKELANVKTIKISWDDMICQNECSGPNNTDCIKQTPWFESTAIELTGDGTGKIKWKEDQQLVNQQVKKDFRKVNAGAHEIVIPLCKSSDPTSGQIEKTDCSSFTSKPYLVRIKPYFCDLQKAVITIHSDGGATSDPQKIPEYYVVNPQGSYGGITSSVRAFVPKDEHMSGLFDFSLFSEEQTCKSDDKTDPAKCD